MEDIHFRYPLWRENNIYHTLNPEQHLTEPSEQTKTASDNSYRNHDGFLLVYQGSPLTGTGLFSLGYKFLLAFEIERILHRTYEELTLSSLQLLTKVPWCGIFEHAWGASVTGSTKTTEKKEYLETNRGLYHLQTKSAHHCWSLSYLLELLIVRISLNIHGSLSLRSLQILSLEDSCRLLNGRLVPVVDGELLCLELEPTAMDV